MNRSGGSDHDPSSWDGGRIADSMLRAVEEFCEAFYARGSAFGCVGYVEDTVSACRNLAGLAFLIMQFLDDGRTLRFDGALPPPAEDQLGDFFRTLAEFQRRLRRVDVCVLEWIDEGLAHLAIDACRAAEFGDRANVELLVREIHRIVGNRSIPAALSHFLNACDVVWNDDRYLGAIAELVIGDSRVLAADRLRAFCGCVIDCHYLLRHLITND